MRIITKSHIAKASLQYPDAKKALEAWYATMKGSRFHHFSEVKAIFGSADAVGRVIVFDIKGNHYRLIAAIHYKTATVYILEVMTHEEYSKNNWKARYKVYD